MQHKLLPIKNVCVSEYYPTTNYLHSKSLFISQFRQTGDNYRTLMQFDMSQFKSSQEIQRAYLQLNIRRNEINSGTVNVGIYRLLHYWDDRVVTWDNMLPLAFTPEYRFVIPTAWVGVILLDITGLTCYWADHLYINHGFIMVGEEHKNSLVAFHSSREDDSNCRPMLIIT